MTTGTHVDAYKSTKQGKTERAEEDYGMNLLVGSAARRTQETEPLKGEGRWVPRMATEQARKGGDARERGETVVQEPEDADKERQKEAHHDRRGPSA